MKKSNRILTGLVCLFFAACTEVEEPTLDNPIDPENPNNQSSVPEAVITSNISSTVSKTSITITWKGSAENSEFAFFLEGKESNFSDWTNQTSITYNFLDEGEYIFYVKERTSSTEQNKATQKSFTVDAITNALVFKSWLSEVNANQESYVDLWIDEVNYFKGFTTQINIDGNITITRITKLVSDVGNIALVTESNFSGMSQIPLDVVLLEANSFSGSSSICRIYFIAQGSGSLSLTGATTIRDGSNNNINLSLLRNTEINIQ